jgi:hypothetical protein
MSIVHGSRQQTDFGLDSILIAVRRTGATR